MIIGKRTHPRYDGTRNLSDVDLGVRQCLQHLWACHTDNKLDSEQLEAHWEHLTARAFKDFLEDQALLQGASRQSNVGK